MTLNTRAYTGLEPGQHDVAVTALEPKTAKAGGRYLRWTFTDRNGDSVTANTAIDLTPKNATGKWFASLTGRPTVVGEPREIYEVIGKAATIEVEENADGYPKVVNLMGRQAANSPVKPLVEATQKAAEQHAIQEGDPVPVAEGQEDLPF